jgi:hypothetical protein
MKTNVRDTSIDNYHSNKFKKQMTNDHKRVVDYVSRLGRATRAMIARDLFNNKTGSASGRVNELVNGFQNPQIFEELSINKCPVTGKRVHWVYVRRDVQLGLF